MLPTVFDSNTGYNPRIYTIDSKRPDSTPCLRGEDGRHGVGSGRHAVEERARGPWLPAEHLGDPGPCQHVPAGVDRPEPAAEPPLVMLAEPVVVGGRQVGLVPRPAPARGS